MGVDRQGLGGPGELEDEAFAGLVVEIRGMVDQRVDQGARELSASVGSTWRRLTRRGGIRRKMSVQSALPMSSLSSLELGEDPLAEDEAFQGLDVRSRRRVPRSLAVPGP